MVKISRQKPLSVGQLPNFEASQFTLVDPPECDMVMKGGITSGVVYPYAVLQIATKYRLRAIGGTSAGAIAAAFAAAAEFGRLNGRPEAYLTLKTYCDELPEKLLSLFQPSPELRPAVGLAKSAVKAGGVRPIIANGLLRGASWGALAAVCLATISHFVQPGAYATTLAGLLGFAVAAPLGTAHWARKVFIAPMADAISQLPAHNFGFCTGKTQPGYDTPGLTNWIYHALQHIAFGDPEHAEPLTFGHLHGADPDKPNIELRMVTTNLSMRRPHTLPHLGVAAGFMPSDWEKLFPQPVMSYLLERQGSKAWRRYKDSWLFPQQDKLPVVVAVRMSLSFPLLFTAVPLIIQDTELPSIVKRLGGKPYPRFRKVHFSDGGISSNFPIHLFDAPLPSRPTFAISLEDLLWDPKEVVQRVALPSSAGDGVGVQIKQIKTIQDFAWQILNSAKDWQDQLLSEITGQRERIVRVFLTDNEGGMNLDMKPETARELMLWGYQAGQKFTDGDFDFNEHKWRRLLVLYRHLQRNLDAIDRIWSGGYGNWYRAYSPTSYAKLGRADRAAIADDIEKLLATHRSNIHVIANPDDKFPRKSGVLKVGPKF